ncbi:hypothetical protein BD779DRAFT_1471577 [Infundibulicybe gibba]|nr:hypothetical protein BD779DRAFT_1471577 [Infundibulicybe gibba]
MSNDTSPRNNNSGAAVGNYPPQDDSTSSGGYGSAQNVWSNKAQRGYTEAAETGLVDQSPSGGDLKHEMRDAKQGVDADTRRDYSNRGGEPRATVEDEVVKELRDLRT